jgi:hypothetical protein
MQRTSAKTDTSTRADHDSPVVKRHARRLCNRYLKQRSIVANWTTTRRWTVTSAILLLIAVGIVGFGRNRHGPVADSAERRSEFVEPHPEFVEHPPQTKFRIDELPNGVQDQVRAVLLETIYDSINRIHGDYLSKLDVIAYSLLQRVSKTTDDLKRGTPKMVVVTLYRPPTELRIVDLDLQLGDMRLVLIQREGPYERAHGCAVICYDDAHNSKDYQYEYDEKTKWSELKASHQRLSNPRPPERSGK